MAGRGGLNLTHSEPLEILLARYGHATAHLADYIKTFDPDAVKTWCHELGEPTFIGSSGRVFPRSMKASPLLRAMLKRLQSQGVALKMRYTWQGWNDTAQLLFASPEGTHVEYPDATLLALGGASWPKLGATGAWTKMLEGQGVAIAPLRPANCGVLIQWTAYFSGHFAGQPLKNIALTVADQQSRGEAMITTTGLEGGVVYAQSAAVREACRHNSSTEISLDLRPDRTHAQLVTALDKRRKGASIATALRQTLALPPVAINLLREATGLHLPQDNYAMASLVKNIPLTCQGVASLDRAISTAGGVPFSECDAHLMLKRVPGAFIAGEMLDWEAPTGGYLLQATLATGVAAAAGIARYLK